ncbi:MAG TPA: hypothetical protein VKE69_12965, partial [Planctomycetota bacterium]|nr:hypothetical protein [Planctomycetota bacterium]
FQWHGQATLDQVREIHHHLYGWKRERAVDLKVHDSERSVIEGVLSRADRRVGRAIEAAYRMGARLDAWDEYFHYDTWIAAFRETGIHAAWYANRERAKDEVFAWDHVDGGVHKQFQWVEYEKARLEAEGTTPGAGFTPECQVGGCEDCGVGPRNCVTIKALTGYFGYSMPKEKAKFREPKWEPVPLKEAAAR